MELAYCVPLGIPHSTFLGWDEADQDKALAWQRSQLGKCADCNTPIHEWMAEDGTTIEPPPFIVKTAICQGCATVAEERKRIRAEAGSDRESSIKVYLAPNDAIDLLLEEDDPDDAR